MSHYKSNLRDIEFNLFEVYGMGEILGKAPFENIDKDTAMDILREIDRLAREDFAASFTEGDRNPPKLVDGEIELSAGVKASLDAVYEGGWHLLGIPKDLGGFGAPDAVRWAASEMMVGANPAVFLYTSVGSWPGSSPPRALRNRSSASPTTWSSRTGAARWC